MISQPLPLTRLIYLILFYNVRIKSNICLFIKNVGLQNLVTLLLLYLYFTLPTYVVEWVTSDKPSYRDSMFVSRFRVFYHRIISVRIFYAQGKLTSVELCWSKFRRRTTEGFPKIVGGLTKRQNGYFRTVLSERIFSVFNRKSVAAKLHNHKFKAKSIRNDMTLNQSSVSNIPDEKVSAILKILNAQEKEWDSKQRELHENKIIEKLKKANIKSIYTTKLLQECKT